ncbi:MAG: zinc-dependent metalloprotease, partial [Actinobacteria bacterium]|nr:zinc-dependent metalloprotease [Actinomycetota bacterium]
PPDTDDPAATLLSGIMKMIGPTMMAMSAGSMVGHLSTRALGSYHLPIPRRATSELAIVGPNVADFVDEWSVDADDVGLWICLHELLHHAVFNIDHVRERIMALLQSFAAGFQQADAGALEQKLGNFEPSGDLEGMQQQMQQIFGDPEMLLGAMRTPAQEAIVPELESLLAVLVGWVDHHLDAIGQHLIGGHEQITEAMRRRRVSAGPQDRFVEKMLGLDLRRDLLERGQSFIAGVVERGGEDQLAKLWANVDHLPTPNEVDAPGLWIARIDLPDLDEPATGIDE